MPKNIITIQSIDDARIDAYTSIRERDLTRGHGGRFIVEGKVTLEALLTRSRFAPESVFVEERRLAPLADLLQGVPPDTPIYVAEQEIMDKIVGFPIHRGVLACARKGTAFTCEDLLPSARTVLCLIGLSNHDNIGACFRNASAFGADAVLLDEDCGEPLYRKSIRVSTGAVLSMPFAKDRSASAMFESLEAAGFSIWSLTPSTDAKPLSSLKRPGKLALVLGTEGAGLATDLISRGTSVRIPMREGFDSVNVATAGAIALSTLFER